MSEQTVAVRLLAHIQGYIDPMKRAAQTTRDFSRELTTAAKAGKLDDLQRGATRFGLVLAAGFGVALMASARFEQAMSEVHSVADLSDDAGVAAQQMEALGKAALKAGADTKFSATEAATAEAELAKAGLSVADITGGALAGSLSLAAAGSLDLAEAADTAAKAMNIFDLNGRDVEHIADVLAAAANKSATDVHELAFALKMGGLAAKNQGLSLEETIGTFAAFADNALVGSDAGTSFKTMLQMLAAPSAQATARMDELGISAYDAQGNFVGLEGLAGQLRTALGDLTMEQRNSALATIFGADAMRAATVLYNEGAEGIAEYVAAVDDQGAAAEAARLKTDNLMGDVEKLTGSLETLFITSGEGANSGLRVLVQALSGVVNFIGALPPAMLTTGTVLIGLTAIVALGVAGWIRYQAAVGSAAKALAAIGPAGAKAAAGLRTAASAAGPAALAIGLAWAGIDQAIHSDHNIDASAKLRFAQPLADLAKQFHVTSGDIKTAAAEIDTALAGMVAEGKGADALLRVEAAASNAGVSVEEFRKLLPQFNEAMKTTADDGGEHLIQTTEELTRAQFGAVEAGEKLIDIWERLNGVAKTADEEMLDAVEAAGDLADAFKENGKLLEGNTEGALKNRLVIADLAEQAIEAADAFIDNGGSAAEATKLIDGFKQEAIKAATAAGLNADEVQRLADQLFRLPAAKSVSITVTANVRLSQRGGGGTGALGVRIAEIPVFMAEGGITGGGRLVRAAQGLISQGMAGISSQTVMWAERPGIPEAYIPSDGDRGRALAIANTAAGWHGGMVVPRDAWYGGASSAAAGMAAVNIRVTAAPGLTSRIVDELRFDVSREGAGNVQSHIGRRGRP